MGFFKYRLCFYNRAKRKKIFLFFNFKFLIFSHIPTAYICYQLDFALMVEDILTLFKEASEAPERKFEKLKTRFW